MDAVEIDDEMRWQMFAGMILSQLDYSDNEEVFIELTARYSRPSTETVDWSKEGF